MLDPQYLSPEETARYICVRVDQLARLVREQKLPVPDYALGRRRPRWDRAKLDAMFRRSDTASTDASMAVQNLVEKIHAQPRPRRPAQAR